MVQTQNKHRNKHSNKKIKQNTNKSLKQITTNTQADHQTSQRMNLNESPPKNQTTPKQHIKEIKKQTFKQTIIYINIINKR